MEYLIALNDSVKDEFFEKKVTTDVELSFVKGRTYEVDEFISLPLLLKNYNVVEK